MTHYYADESVTLYHGDCLDVLRSLPDNSVDSVVTDPPYGLEFMGKDWDAPWKAEGAHWREASRLPGSHSTNPTPRPQNFGTAGKPFQDWCEAWATECLRVLKPGGHLLAFGGTRTWHRLACAVEDAGFEVRDSIAWLYGSGFPKSLDVSKAIDKMDAADVRRSRNLAFTEWMRSTGVTSRQIDVATSSFMGGHYLTAREQAAVPTADMFDLIRPLLDVEVPDWVEALIRERTVESENYKAREVLATERRANEPSGIVGVGQGERVMFDRRITAAHTDAARTWQGWGTALKPSHEPVCVAMKPYAVGDILAGIGSQLGRLESECRQRANDAARSSAPTPRGSSAARTDSAPASAATPPEGEPARTTPTGAAAGSSAQTAMSASGSTGETCWNTVTSWRACWAELCDLTSTFTTSTTTEATTDLRTLWSSISSLTVTSTPGSPTPALTSGSTASAVDGLFAATVLRLRATLALSAAEPATADTRQDSQDAAGSSPAFEPIVVARKPLVGTVAANVLTHGTGALNIDDCRVGTQATTRTKRGGANDFPHEDDSWTPRDVQVGSDAGRWPANVVLDESQAEALDEQSGDLHSQNPATRKSRSTVVGDTGFGTGESVEYDDTGGASRFFYVAKAGQDERPRVNGTAHPTVKPLELIRWLVRLVTPPGGTVLEPFAGSGTTVEACIVERFRCIAIEREVDYLPLIESRIARRRDPVKAITLAGEDLGLFGEASA
jgi:DNA modification methylase